MAEVILDGTRVGPGHPAYFIAEIGSNHLGRVDEAKALIRMAKEAGCQAVKFQKRDLRALYTEAFYNSPYNSEAAYAPTYGKHREALELSMTQYRELQAYATDVGLAFFATAFDLPSVDFLEDIGVPFYKVASGSIQNPRLLRRLALLRKPIIVSFGGATPDDMDRVVRVLSENDAPLILMHCTASYPTAPEDLGLGRIDWMASRYSQHVIGFSDHDDGVAMGAAAYVLGARVFEKHITTSHTNRGTDHAFSLEYNGLRAYVRNVRKAAAADKLLPHPLPSEEKPLVKMGYGVYPALALPEGTIIQQSQLVVKSPAAGLPGWALDGLVGRKLRVDVAKEQPLEWGMFE